MDRMRPIESLHYAIGLLAFAVARADGEVQKAERQKFHNIVASGLGKGDPDFDVSGIIFQVMDKEKKSTAETFDLAMSEIRKNGHYVSPQMKRTFITVMEQVAKAYPPVTIDERSLIDKFKEEMEQINRDPAIYP